MNNKEEFKFKVGQKVVKKTGYKFPGIIVCCYHTLSGKARYVVECTAEDVAGCQHIFNADQLNEI